MTNKSQQSSPILFANNVLFSDNEYVNNGTLLFTEDVRVAEFSWLYTVHLFKMFNGCLLIITKQMYMKRLKTSLTCSTRNLFNFRRYARYNCSSSEQYGYMPYTGPHHFGT